QLAREAVDVLRVIRTPGIPSSDIQHSVRAEADSAAIVVLSGWNSIDDRAIEAGRLAIRGEAPALHAIERLTTLFAADVEIEGAVAREIRVQSDAQQPAFIATGNGKGCHRLREHAAFLEQAHAAWPLGDQHPAFGKEGNSPG